MSEASILGAALQFPVSMDVSANLSIFETLLNGLPEDALVVTPEGALSGYRPEPGFVNNLNSKRTADAIEHISDIALDRRVHIIAGACVLIDNTWRNSSFLFGADGKRQRYDKVNLAQSERGTFEPGNTLPVFKIEIAGKPVRLGIQMCREIRYPEQWRVLAEQGAQVIAYPNNAVGSKKGDALWRAHLTSRAAETQRFIIGANNSASDQTCPTVIIDPTGDILADIPIGKIGRVTADLSLEKVSNSVLQQARCDIVRVEHVDHDSHI